jgi:hypothetical protein
MTVFRESPMTTINTISVGFIFGTMNRAGDKIKVMIIKKVAI